MRAYQPLCLLKMLLLCFLKMRLSAGHPDRCGVGHQEDDQHLGAPVLRPQGPRESLCVGWLRQVAYVAVRRSNLQAVDVLTPFRITFYNMIYMLSTSIVNRYGEADRLGRARWQCRRTCLPHPPWRQPRGKLMVSLVNAHTNATRIGWHL